MFVAATAGKSLAASRNPFKLVMLDDSASGSHLMENVDTPRVSDLPFYFRWNLLFPLSYFIA
jgi:hypothetical protein